MRGEITDGGLRTRRTDGTVAPNYPHHPPDPPYLGEGVGYVRTTQKIGA